MTNKIFISYRRQNGSFAGRISDRLEHQFGRKSLFVDIDAIPLGVDVTRLNEEVAMCDVLLALIGPNWTDLRDEHGNRFLENKNDYVRLEIGSALKRDIPVIPVIADRGELPKVENYHMT
jgi:hypothetical protein